MAREKLFGAFTAVTREQWEAIIKKELKGADPTSLDVKLDDGLVLPPIHLAPDGGPMSDRRRGVKRIVRKE